MEQKKVIALLLGLLSILCLRGNGLEQYEFDYKLSVISVNDGLPQQTVTSIIEDNYGFFWFGTFDGLCRYDGLGFRTYHHIPEQESSISNNRILSLLLDSSGCIWIGTEGNNALNRYDWNTDGFEQFTAKGVRDIRALCEGPDKTLWIGCATGIYRGIWEGDAEKPTLSIEPAGPESLRGRPIRQLFFDGNGELWTIVENTIVSIGRDAVSRVHSLPRTGRIETLYADSRNNIFVCTRDSLYVKYNHSSEFQTVDLSGIAEMFSRNRVIHTLTELRERIYLVGTESDGMFLMQLGDNGSCICARTQIDAGFFDNNLLRLFYKDRNDCLWIGSGHNGVAHIDLQAKKFRRWELPDGSRRNFVRTLFRDSRSRMWIGIKLGGVYLEENGSYRKMEVDPRQDFNAIVEDRRGNIWICANCYVYVYHDGRMYDLKDLPGVPDDIYVHISHANAICEDSFGAIWIGGVGKTVRLADPFGTAPGKGGYRYYDAAFTRDLFCMYNESESNRIWCGSRSKGLYVIDPDEEGTVRHVSRIDVYGDRIKSDHIWSICGTGPGVVWVGTDAGLNKISIIDGDTTVTNIAASPKVAHGKIMAVTRDRQGDLWLNTSQGLIRYAPETGTYNEYYYADGLCSNTMTEAACVDSRGMIYIGTIDGINYFDPAQISNDVRTSAPLLVGLKVNNVPVRPSSKSRLLQRNIIATRHLVFGHRENNFSFEFIAPYYRNPERTRYAYKMEGADEQWIEVSGAHREATYSRLRAGNYRFMLRAANPDGVWDDTVQSIDITVRPAPWNTWWAYLLYILAAGGITATILRYYWLQYKFKNDARIEHIQREHEKILHDLKLKFHTNISHEIKTALTLIKSPLDEIDPKEMGSAKSRTRIDIIRRNVDYLNSLVQQFLDLRRIDKEALPLCVMRDDAVAIAIEVYTRFREAAELKQIDFLLDCEIASIRGWFDRDKLVKIISNLVSNALKFTPEGGAVSLIIDRTGDSLVVIVQDSGEGIDSGRLKDIFNRFYQGANHENTGTGIGLALVSRLTELHRGKIDVTSRPDEGSTFTLTIPCNREAYEDLLDGEARPEEIAPDENAATAAVEPPESKPMVMIVDDNSDMREYLSLDLRDHYNLICAEDAESGIEKALKYIPDLIILDVMLPGRSGLEVCAQLKANQLTCHIPVVILSAKGERSDIAKGYECGAEDYLQKPFSNKLLLWKIGNIIKYRRNAQNSGERTDAGVETEDRLVVRIREIIASNYHNSEFRINDVCSMLCMSHTQLYRKLKAVSDKTFSDMLRDYRMKEACDLLLHGNYNCSEVMYRVGISSNSYFTKTFREYFGITPSDMIKKRPSLNNR